MASSPNLSGSITMTDNASAVLAKVRGEMERTNTAASKGSTAATSTGASWGKAALGIGVAALGFGALTRAIEDSIKAAVEDDKSVRSLNQALLNSGQSFATKELGEWTQALQLSLGVSDDLIRNGLRAMTNAGAETAESQKLVALSLDIAAGSGRDAASVQAALAKAYGGQTTALGRLGVGIDKATLASGDMDKITAILSAKFSGQAKVASESYAGSMAKLSEAASEASESVGYSLLRAIDTLTASTDGAGGAGQAIVSFGDGIGEIVDQAMLGAQAIDSLAGSIGKLIPGSDDAGDSQSYLARQMTILKDSVVTFASGPMVMLGGIYDEVRDKTSDNATASDRYHYALQAQAAAARDAATENEDLAPEIDKVALAALAADTNVSGLAEAMGMLDTKANQQQALQSWRQGLADFVEKPSTDAALGLVSDFTSAYESFKDGGRAQAKFVIKNYADMRTAIKNSGLSEAAQAELIQPLTDAKNEARQVLWRLDQLDGKTVSVSVVMSQLGAAWGKANGGYITGPGTSTSDSIPARLSNGEYVIRAAAVRAIGINNLNMLNARGFKNGGSPTFSNPGPSNIAQAGYNYTPGRGASVGTPYSSNPDWTGGKFIDGMPTYETGRVAKAAEAAEQAAEAAERAARAAEEAARAEAARLAEIHRQQQIIIGQARDILADAQGTRNDYARTTASTSIGFGSISGFSSGASDWAALSMRAPGSEGAGGPANSGGSISDYMAGKLARVKTFGAVLQKLALAGLNSSTLRDVINAGPDEGTTLGQALLDAGVGEIGKVNSIQTSLENNAGAIGAFGGNSIFGGAVMDAYGNYQSVVGSNGGVDDTPIQVNLMLDGQTVVTQLLSLKRANGGASLGLG